MDTGVKARSLKPIFPSKTFPNHYTLVTGLYAESHGIIGNRMYDPVFDAVYTISGPEAKRGRWYGGEPIWVRQRRAHRGLYRGGVATDTRVRRTRDGPARQVTAVKQGLRSGSVFWPGSEAEIKGTRPTYYRTFDSSVTFEQRVDQVGVVDRSTMPRSLRWLIVSFLHRGQHVCVCVCVRVRACSVWVTRRL